MKKLLQHFKNQRFVRTLILVFVIAATLGVYVFFGMRQGRVFIDDSLVSAPISSIAPTTPGTLLSINVYENQQVKKGDAIGVIGGQTLYTNTDGLIIMANNQIGSIVGPTAPVAQLINPANMRIAGTIDENKGLSDIRVGQVASFTVDALPGKTFWGYVDEISPSAKQNQLSFSISSERPTQQFIVYTRFDGLKYPEIKNGMSAKMTIYTKTK